MNCPTCTKQLSPKAKRCAGRFEEAWAKAEDILADYFTAETREREEEVT